MRSSSSICRRLRLIGRSSASKKPADFDLVARELAPAGLRSGPNIFAVAARPSGSKLPRHKSIIWKRGAKKDPAQPG
ncbi:hypothetical protein B1218_10955 [Pseudomonas ogarae]|nr:hypothetical protein B1218_10955 [Pseudomonas ogarae]